MNRNLRLSLLVGILGILGCARPSTRPQRAQKSISVMSPECYSLAYANPVGTAAPRLFPIWVKLFPGSDSGAVMGRPHKDFDPREWTAMNGYTWWKAIPSDSIEVNFSGNYEAIHLHVQRQAAGVQGRATYLSDLVDGIPPPSMAVVGTRQTC
jgi:hypothetical protein